MSTFGAILDRVLAECVVAIPTLKTLRGPIDIELLRPQDLPHLQVRLPARVTTGELDFRQQEFDLGAEYVYVDRKKTQEELIVQFELIEQRFRVLPDLLLPVVGVLWTRITSMQISDVPLNERGYNAITFELVVEQIQW